MNLLKLAILSGGVAISIGFAAPAQATWYPHNGGSHGGWSTSGGWGSSGWGSSGWGSSGWGSSGYGGTTTSTSTSSSGTASTSSPSSGSSSGSTPIPEPSNVIMLALGVAGLVAGRFAARSKRAKRDKL